MERSIFKKFMCLLALSHELMWGLFVTVLWLHYLLFSLLSQLLLCSVGSVALGSWCGQREEGGLIPVIFWSLQCVSGEGLRSL